MHPNYFYKVAGLVTVAGFLSMAGSASAITVTIDGISSPTVLSDAVDTCMSAGAGPHTINITTDTLATADRQVVITAPITINGDADNNSVPCDILADMTGIRAGADAGIQAYKSYIEVQTAGLVSINDLNIHPNEDGAFATFANSPVNNVSGIRLFKPALATDTGTYNLKNVGVSGSASDNSYLSLGTATDLFNMGGRKRWAGLSPDGVNEVNYVKQAAIHYSDDPIGQGALVSTLDHCEAGLSRGVALSITTTNTVVQVLGGVYGHSARDGIRVADGANVTIKGTATDRVRVVRAANIATNNSHSIEVAGGGIVPLIEYTDVAGETTANGLALREGRVDSINYFRNLGKLGADPNNHAVIISGAGMSVGQITNSTIHGDGSPIGDPLGINGGVIEPVVIRDTIFTSQVSTETINVGSPVAGIVTFQNCALTSDGQVNETMGDPAITAGVGLPAEGAVIINNCIYSAPQYLLTLADYDWSDTQGALDPLNGPGNRNVLRPSNVAYLTAGTGGTALVGGAGPIVSGIDAGTWMLME